MRRGLELRNGGLELLGVDWWGGCNKDWLERRDVASFCLCQVVLSMSGGFVYEMKLATSHCQAHRFELS